MIGTFFDYLIGFSRFSVTAESDEICDIMNQIKAASPKSVRISENKLHFICPLRYRSEAYTCVIKYDENAVVKDYGISVLVRMTFKRKGIVAAAFACLILWCYISNIIWSLDVSGNESISEGRVLSALSSVGVKEGVFIPSLNTKKLVLDFLVNNNEISWMHLNINGTDATAEITERKSPPERIDKIKSSNIVAKCDGVIVRADVYSGGREVEIGDTVQEGQLLVSSFFETRKAGQLLRRAKGSIYARTYPTYVFMVAKEKDNTELSHEFSEYEISFLSYRICIPSFNFCSKEKSYRTEKSEIKVKIADVIEFPFSIIKTEYLSGSRNLSAVSKDDAMKMFQSEYALWKRGFDRIEREETKMRESDSHYIFEVSLECVENIAFEVPYEFIEN